MAAFGRGAAAWLGKLVYAAVVLAGCALAGCTTDGSPIFAVGGRSTATVAFESIDGPPETVFRRLVLQLNQEANARQISVVSRELAGAIPHSRLCGGAQPSQALDPHLGVGHL